MRNRVLHDMWLPDPLRDDWQPPRWNTFRRTGDLQIGYASASVQDLAMVMDAHTLRTRTRVRVSGLFEVVRGVANRKRPARGEWTLFDPRNRAKADLRS